jgi:hypothetical protein
MRRAQLVTTLALLALTALGGTAHAATERANLTASKLTASPTTLPAGATITATVNVINAGSVKARSTKTFFILSIDDHRSGDDLRLASVKTAKLKSAKSKAVKFTGVIPATAKGGKYFFLACADGTRTVREKSERDNCKSQAITVTSPAPPVATTPTVPGPILPPAPIDTDADGIADDVDNCTSQANPDQSDIDADGKGDVCDSCPSYSNPGGSFCPATIEQVKTAVFPEGVGVEISSVVITAVSGTRAWAQDAASAGAPNGGIQLNYASSGSVSVGDHLNVGGTITAGQRLSISTSSVVGAPVPVPAPLVVTAATLASNAQAYDSLLVRVNNSDKVDTYGATGLLLMDSSGFFALTTDVYATPPFPNYADGGGYDFLVGISGNDGVQPLVRPRTSADFGTFFPI